MLITELLLILLLTTDMPPPLPPLNLPPPCVESSASETACYPVDDVCKWGDCP
jgi:hypothetical protein